MNKTRRKQLSEAVSKLEEAMQIVDDMRSEEEDAYLNMPESLQESERGQQMDEYINSMDEASGSIDEAISVLQEIIDG